MKFVTKAALLLSAVSATTVSAGVALAKNPFNFMAFAEGEVCEHVGNHYTKRSETKTASGCKEYWVCCLCHEHFLTNLGLSTWTDCGEATLVWDESQYDTNILDSRFIPKIPDEEDPEEDDLAAILTAMGFSGVEYSEEKGGYVVNGYDPNKTGGSGKEVIIPEGVVEIAANTFKGNNDVDYVVIPESIDDNLIKGMFQTGASKVTLYFVGITSCTSSSLKCKAIYDNQGVNWDYEGNVPTPKPGAVSK